MRILFKITASKLILAFVISSSFTFISIVSMTQEEALQILGFEKNSTPTIEDIRKAYRQLALKLHPDKNLSEKQQAEEKFKNLSNAYDLLKNNIPSKSSGKTEQESTAQKKPSAKEGDFFEELIKKWKKEYQEIKKGEEERFYNNIYHAFYLKFDLFMSGYLPAEIFIIQIEALQSGLETSSYSTTEITKKFLYIFKSLSKLLTSSEKKDLSGEKEEDSLFKDDIQRILDKVKKANTIFTLWQSNVNFDLYIPEAGSNFSQEWLTPYLQFIDVTIRMQYVVRFKDLISPEKDLSSSMYIKEIVNNILRWTGIFQLKGDIVKTTFRDLFINKKYIIQAYEDFMVDVGNDAAKDIFNQYAQELTQDNVNMATKENITLLMMAARYGDTALSRLLIAKKADINKQDKKGLTAL